MHLAILALGFAKLLSLFGVGKKLGTLATLMFTVLYMALTGFPISVVRAGIMLVISSLLFLFASASDSFTNLSLSVFLIVLINPYSIFDISLLLSAFATLGIVVLADLPKNYVHKKKLWFKILNSFVISLFAISATFLISVLSFEEISILSPLSTFIFALLVEVFLYFGTFFMIFGGILPLGGILTFFGDIIKNLAERFSSIRYITVNNDFLFIKITAVSFTIIFFLFLILDFKNKRRGVALISSLMALILLSSVIFTYNAENKERLTYYKTDKGDAILLSDKSEISLIESKTYTKNKIYETLNYLNEEKLTRLDNYILTDYNSKLPSALYALLSELKISNIYLPKPRSDEEIIIYQKILSLEESFDVYIEVYDTEKIEFECFDFNSPYREAEIGIFSITFKNKEYRILSSGVFDSKAQNIAIKEINSADYLIMSRHGKSYKDYNFTYEFKNLKAIIISSKNVYIPKETKEYYKKSGAKLNFTPEKYEFIR
jgi:competence protein ComEC